MKIQYDTNPKQVVTRKRRAFTLLQIVVVVSVVAILSAILMPAFTRSRAAARRAQCDSRLKTITLALDAFRAEHDKYPLSLEELETEGYIKDTEVMSCPDDPRPKAEQGYKDYYVVRAARDEANLPIVVCPFHEEYGYGAQGYKGQFTTQHSTKPARIVNARNTTVQRPGKSAIAAAAGMALQGGDRIVVGSGLFTGGLLGTGLLDSGEAILEFADGTRATLRGGTDLMILQSFTMGGNGPLYTLVKQRTGKATYEINHGSRFDVGTPTATAGARGTKFTVTIAEDGGTELYVTEGKVLFSTQTQTQTAPLFQIVKGLLNGLISLL